MIAVGIGLAAVGGFVLSGAYYVLVPAGSTPAGHEPSRPTWLVAVVELLRTAATAGLLAGLLTAGRWSGAATGALFGLALVVLPVVLLAGSVFHEGTPLSQALRHAGDWLLKLPAVGAIIGLTV